jgi:hypothetical protein
MCITSAEYKTVITAMLTVKSSMNLTWLVGIMVSLGMIGLLGVAVGAEISWSNHPVGAGDSVGSYPVGAEDLLSFYPVGARVSL